MRSPQFAKYEHSGVVLDLVTEEIPVTNWTDCRNFVFKEQGSERVGGYAEFGSTLPIIDPIFAMMYINGPDTYWIYCTPTKIWATNGYTQWDITPTGGLSVSEAGDWTGTTLNGLPILNNGINAPLYWDGSVSNPCKVLPGWPPNSTANSVRAFKYHLIAMGITQNGTDYPHLVWWSAAADPGTVPATWVPAPDNDAGDTILADTPGRCIDGLPLRDVFIIYKEFSTYILTYVAGQYVFSARKLFLTSGIQSNNCIAEINGEHWVVTTTDVIKHDGQSFTSVVSNTVRNTLINSINQDKTKQVCLVSRQNKQQVWVCIPEANENWITKAYLINTETGAIGIRDLPNVSFVTRGVITDNDQSLWSDSDEPWDTDVNFWNEQVYAATEDSIVLTSAKDDALWAVDVVATANGAPINAYLERTGLPIGNYTDRKIITRVIPRVDGTVGDTIYIRIGGQSVFGKPTTWSDALPFVIGTDVAVHAIAEGRMVSVRFEGTTDNIWRVHSYTVEFVQQGYY